MGDMNLIEDAIEQAEAPKETDEQAIKRLAALSPMEYDRVREEEAKSLGVRVSSLDKEVQGRRKALKPDDEMPDELVDGIEPWPDEVNGEVLAGEIRATFNRYCALPEGGDIALTLWVIASYCINAFRIFPKVCLSSPEKRCGKTTTLEVVGALAHRSLVASNLTPSVLFRSIEAWQPSLLIDEGDTFLNDNEELRGIINSGHTRSTAFVLRTEENNGVREPVKFSTWAPMMIAMIKTPPDTIKDRSIMVHLRRKLPGEQVERLSYELADDCGDLRRKCKRLADDIMERLWLHDPEIPRLANDRAMDNWLPLLSVADLVGGEWPQLARGAMMKMEQAEDDNDTVGQMLLKDIREMFQQRQAERLFSDDLVRALVAMEERPWCDWRRGKPITKNSLARLLAPFQIKSRDLRLGSQVKKGYRLSDFADAFERYLPRTPPDQNATTLQARSDAGSSQFQNATQGKGVAFQKSPQPYSHAGCSVVAFENGGIEGQRGEKQVSESNKPEPGDDDEVTWI